MFHSFRDWLQFYCSVKYPFYKQMEKHWKVWSWAKGEKFAIKVKKKIYKQYLKESKGIDKHNLL